MKAVRYRLTWSELELFDPPDELPFIFARAFELEDPELLSEKPGNVKRNTISSSLLLLIRIMLK